VSGDELGVRRLEGDGEADACARMMAASEPWITLGRSLEKAREILASPAKEVWVVPGADGPRAFAILDLQGAFVGYLQTICVRPDERGRGVGTRLLAWAESRIFRDSPNVFLCVSTFNADARRLYERLGYSIVGTLDDYIVRGHGEHLMRKTRGPWREFTRP
jgi:ribosomal protein S18 acetylase RimI-like enzyme